MPNPDRNLFFEHQGRPTQRTWQDGYSELSLKVYRAFDRVIQLTRYPDPVTVSHATVTASASDPVIIDFRLAQSYDLLLNATRPVVIVPPLATAVPRGRAGAWTLEMTQAPGGPYYVSAWYGCVFYPLSNGHSTPLQPDFSTTAGFVDVVAFRYSGFAEQMRGMFRAGCPA